jgi:hypothetical protein
MMRSINSGLLEKRSVLSHRWAVSQSGFDRTVAGGRRIGSQRLFPRAGRLLGGARLAGELMGIGVTSTRERV